jgi:RND family efflux transporter MFP subunit
MPRLPIILAAALLSTVSVVSTTAAGEFVAKSVAVADMKAVYARVEARDTVAARARIGGTVVSLNVEEGSAVTAGDVIAVVVDDKLAIQLEALDARITSLESELSNAMTELKRGKALLAAGTIPKSRVEVLETQVDILTGQLNAAKAERAVIVQQAQEGKVLAPSPGRVLSVPVTKGSVIMPGEPVARIAGGGYFLRLSLPERHAANIHEGDEIQVGQRGLAPSAATGVGLRKGTLVKVYPEIEGGRVLADAEVDGLGDFFVGERTLVMIPVDQRQSLTIPAAAVVNQQGVDYVRVKSAGGETAVAVIIGHQQDGMVEILSGLRDGDIVVTP